MVCAEFCFVFADVLKVSEVDPSEREGEGTDCHPSSRGALLRFCPLAEDSTFEPSILDLSAKAILQSILEICVWSASQGHRNNWEQWQRGAETRNREAII